MKTNQGVGASSSSRTFCLFDIDVSSVETSSAAFASTCKCERFFCINVRCEEPGEVGCSEAAGDASCGREPVLGRLGVVRL